MSIFNEAKKLGINSRTIEYIGDGIHAGDAKGKIWLFSDQEENTSAKMVIDEETWASLVAFRNSLINK